MTMGHAEITAAVLRLPTRERVAFGQAVILSLEKDNLDSATRARVDELRKRFEILKARHEARVRSSRIFWNTRGTLRRIGSDVPEPLSVAEIQRRVQELDAGIAETVPAEEVFREAREALRRVH